MSPLRAHPMCLLSDLHNPRSTTELYQNFSSLNKGSVVIPLTRDWWWFFPEDLGMSKSHRHYDKIYCIDVTYYIFMSTTILIIVLTNSMCWTWTRKRATRLVLPSCQFWRRHQVRQNRSPFRSGLMSLSPTVGWSGWQRCWRRCTCSYPILALM